MRPIHYLRCFFGIAVREWLRFLNLTAVRQQSG